MVIKDALGSLARYSLVEVEKETSPLAVSVHRVVKRVVRAQHAEGNELMAWGCATLRSISQNCDTQREESLRHGHEALAIVPATACPAVRQRLSKLLHEQEGPLFARASEIQQIHLYFAERNQRTVIIAGVGGSGKTTLARMYAEDRRSYEQVWWLDGSDETELLWGLTDLARKAGNRVEATGLENAAWQALEFAHNLGRRRRFSWSSTTSRIVRWWTGGFGAQTSSFCSAAGRTSREPTTPSWNWGRFRWKPAWLC